MARVEICKGGLSAAIDTHGAQLRSLALDGNEYLWQADARWWGKSAPVLFPIVGSLRGGKATCGQGTCELGRHGLARDLEHAVAEQAEDQVTLRLESSDGTKARYPYDFRLEDEYRLEGAATLAHTFRVTNTCEVDMPFCVGGHPAFNVPAPGCEDEAFEDYELRFAGRFSCDSPLIVEGGLLDYGTHVPVVRDADRVALTRELFANDALVLQDVPESTVELVGPAGHGVRVDFGGFGWLGVWSAAGDAPFVALEPWCGTATRTDEDDVLEHKQGVLVARPGETIERTFRITLL